MRVARLFWMMVRLSLQNDAAYRLDFFVQLFNALTHTASMLLGLWVVFHNTDSVNGWCAAHMLVLIGVFRLMSGVIALIIAPNMRQLMEDVRAGTLDFVLLRPVNSQFLVSARRLSVWRIFDVLIGAVVAVVGTLLLRGRLEPGALALFVLMLTAGATIMYAIWLALATLSFWLVRVMNLEMIFWNVFEAARYPVSIYPPPVRFALTYVLPAAFVVTFPAQALAGGAGDTVPLLSAVAIVSALVIAPICLAAASAFWRFGLRRYSGASA